jgi:hypothetical protein
MILRLGIHTIVYDDVVGKNFIQHEDAGFDASTRSIDVLSRINWRQSWTEVAGWAAGLLAKFI